MKLANLLLRANRNKPSLEVEEELRFHLEMLEHKYAQQGMCVTDAKAAALRRFGNLERVKRQCVDISTRNSLLRRVLKTLSILLALAGLAIRILSSDLHVARIGTTLIMIAVSALLLLYVRGLGSSTFLPKNKARSLITNTSENGSNLRQA